MSKPLSRRSRDFFAGVPNIYSASLDSRAGDCSSSLRRGIEVAVSRTSAQSFVPVPLSPGVVKFREPLFAKGDPAIEAHVPFIMYIHYVIM